MEIEIKPLKEQRTIDIGHKITQGRLALSFTALVGVTILSAIGAIAYSPANAPVIKDIITPLMNSLLIMYGVIIGYYFGSQTGK